MSVKTLKGKGESGMIINLIHEKLKEYEKKRNKQKEFLNSKIYNR